MKHPTQNEFGNGADAGTSEAEQTLRLIAHLPAPEGLEDRVQAGLRSRQMDAAPGARILAWPALRPASGWMRTAAAAAIVFVVAGGGWGVYTHVQPQQSAKVIVMPPRVVSPGGFSNASAMHVPNTLNGPTIPNPAATSAAQPKVVAMDAKGGARPGAKPGAKKAVRRAHAVKPGNQATPQAAAQALK
jgi:hypothetical protein